MDTSIKWIKDLVPGLECTNQEFRDAMTLSGTKVECFNELDKNLDKIVVGQIVSVERHPDADKLVVCQVNVGNETVQIVTGAPNIEPGTSGQKVPVVLDGGRVAGGHDGSPLPEDGIKIKKGKLRGVESYGMMCSIEELGSSREFYPDAAENGIYIFGDDAKVGESAVEYLGLDDTVFEYEITNNRVDCYSILGIAREAAATFRKPFNPPVVNATGNSEDVNDYIKIEVAAKQLCKRYTARVVKNIKLAPSPKWMQHRLMTAGIRPINNIVDITNYVMTEYGQRMHAFVYDTIADKKIIVRTAAENEKFVTLDGQERTLDSEALLICDGEKAIAFARERKAFAAGDFQRGRNQTAVIKGIIQKATSPAILTRYSAVMDTVSDMFLTNIPSSAISDLVKLQLSNSTPWNIQTYSISGKTDEYRHLEVSNVYGASIVLPYEEDISTATKLMNKVIAGETFDVDTYLNSDN